MKIRAIRLREVGCFARPTIVEGLTGGLDVLAERNEAGKSTLLSALRACFLDKHSAQNKEIKELLPYRGGAPLIEVDFEAAGAAFRLRKQFLSSPSAELREIGSGAVLARGAEAHDRALQLIGAPAAKEPFGLFWVAQGASLQPLAPTEEDGRAIASFIEREVKTVTGGRRARAAIEEARKEREALVSVARGQPRGPYADAVKAVESLAAEVEKARAERDAVETLLRRLEDLRTKRQALREPARWAGFKEAVRQAEAMIDRAKSAKQSWQVADGDLKLAAAERDAAVRSLKDYDESLARFASQEQEIAECVRLVEEKRGVAAKAKSDVHAAEGRLREARAEVRRAEELLRGVAESERLAAQVSERAEIVLKLERVQAILQSLREAEALLTQNRATRAVVSRVEEQKRDIETLRARLTAGAPSVSIAYASGGEGRAKTRSGPLIAGQVLRVTEPLEIELESVGTLFVRPSEKAQDDLERLHKAEETLSRALTELGVPDMDSVYRLKAEREAAERTRRIAAEQLAILAPEGIDFLRRRLDSLPEPMAEPISPLPQLSDAEHSHSEARRAALGADAELAKLNERSKAADLLLAAETAKLKALEDRHGADASCLPAARERAAARAAFERVVLAWDQNVADRREEAERAKRSLDEIGDLACFERRLKQAREAEQRAADELSECEREIARTEGELKHAFSAGAGERLQALEGQLELAQARVTSFVREVAELDLLISVLSQAAAEAKEAFFRPVVERLKPMLQRVLPEAEMEFDEGFRPDKLIRSSQPEDLWRLSGGTREQIAVLVRLAFAHLMVDGGKPAPVILDDALVFAGDERLDGLFSVLRTAAERHQLIVLTCRSRAFEPLGGNRVTLETRDFT